MVDLWNFGRMKWDLVEVKRWSGQKRLGKWIRAGDDGSGCQDEGRDSAARVWLLAAEADGDSVTRLVRKRMMTLQLAARLLLK
jgi:hypothetical protein